MPFHWDRQGRWGRCSPAALDLMGLGSAPTLDAFIDMVHPDDRLRVEGQLAAFVEEGGTHSNDFRLVRPDGGIRHVFVHVAAASDGMMDGFFIDRTTERIRAEKPLATTTERFGFYDFDVLHGTSSWSPGLRNILHKDGGLPLSGDEIFELVHPQDRDEFVQRMQTILRRPGLFDERFRVVLPNGQLLWVRDRGETYGPVDPQTGQVARVTGTLTDVTHAMPDPDPLRSGQDAFWALIDTAPFGVYAVDADFRIVRLSAGGQAAFAGIEPLIGRDLGEVLHILWSEPFASDAIAHFRHTLATGEPYRAPPVIEDRADRQKLEAYDWGIDRMRLDDGCYGVICHFYDLTDRVLQERAFADRERRLNLAYDAADMGAWEVDLATGDVVWTPQLYRIFGAQAEAETAIDAWSRAVHPDDRARVDAGFAEAAAAGGALNVEFRIVLPDGEIRYIATRGEVLTDGGGTPVRMIGVNWDITNQTMAEQASRDAEHRLRVVMDNAVAFIGVLDPDGTLREANATALAVADLPREAVIGKPFWETFWWAHDPAVADRLRDAHAQACDGTTAHYDTVVRIAGGALITIEFMLAPVFDDAGRLTMLVASGFDISEREEQRARNQSLMGEINHRSKNILTLVQIIARQTARGGAGDFVSRFETRIGALAQAQDLLVKGSADKVDLRDLALSQLGHFRDLVEQRIALDGPAILVGPAAAQSIGMALHELATNAGKYGALSTGAGRIDISWRVEDAPGSGPVFTMEWRESGGPTVVPPDRRGFGSTVIEDLAGSNLNGAAHTEYDPAGLRWALRCPFDASWGTRAD